MAYSLFSPDHQPKKIKPAGVLMPDASDKLPTPNQTDLALDDEAFLQNLTVELAREVRRRAQQDKIGCREAWLRMAQEAADEDRTERAVRR